MIHGIKEHPVLRVFLAFDLSLFPFRNFQESGFYAAYVNNH